MTTCLLQNKLQTKAINSLGSILSQDIVILGQLNLEKIVCDPLCWQSVGSVGAF